MDAVLLKVDIQRCEPVLWAAVQPDQRMVQHKFRVYGTGHDMDGIGKYIGTIQMQNGMLVWHVFDYGEDPAW